MVNLDLAYQILEILKTIKEAVIQIKKYHEEGDENNIYFIVNDVEEGILAIQSVLNGLGTEKKEIRLYDACICILESMKDIISLIDRKKEMVSWKLEDELLAIIETSMMQFYYWGIVKNHPQKINEFLNFLKKTDTFNIINTNKYDCDLTIAITGYNKLEYTKKCVESVLENIPKEISYELILLNHGSTDETKEYFESIDNAKVINIAVNGAVPGVILKSIFRGKYSLGISNDIIVGKNSIRNLYRSVLEHPDYGSVVPTTPAVSNYQTIPAKYDNLKNLKNLQLKIIYIMRDVTSRELGFAIQLKLCQLM